MAAVLSQKRREMDGKKTSIAAFANQLNLSQEAINGNSECVAVHAVIYISAQVQI